MRTALLFTALALTACHPSGKQLRNEEPFGAQPYYFIQMQGHDGAATGQIWTIWIGADDRALCSYSEQEPISRRHRAKRA